MLFEKSDEDYMMYVDDGEDYIYDGGDAVTN